MTGPTPVDHLKYAAAEGKELLSYVIDRLGQIASNDVPLLGGEQAEMLEEILLQVSSFVHHAAAGFCTDRQDLDACSDGREVETSVVLECGNWFTYRWHPDPTDESNRSRTLIDGSVCTSGSRHSVIISADQVLDVVHHPRLLRPVEEADTAEEEPF